MHGGGFCWSCGESIQNHGSEVWEGTTALSLSSWHLTSSHVPLLWHSAVSLRAQYLSLPWLCLVDVVWWLITDQSSKPCVTQGIAEGQKAYSTVLQMLAVQVRLHGLQVESHLVCSHTIGIGWKVNYEWSKLEYWGILGKVALISVLFNIL